MNRINHERCGSYRHRILRPLSPECFNDSVVIFQLADALLILVDFAILSVKCDVQASAMQIIVADS